MRLLLLSTYELGRQPVHLASPAAALRAAGHEIAELDLSLDELTTESVDWAERVAISVPMHTATRLADQVIRLIGESRPDLPVATYGLYAGVGSAEVDRRFEGEYEPGLLAWCDDQDWDQRHLGRSDFLTPDRAGLPALDRYARLEHRGESHLAAAVEASHGCRHRCRHCPIPAVYDGRLRVVPRDQVLADIDNLAAAGARHITFGDADFLNAPAHSMAVLERANQSHPHLTFDATIKVSHILDHADLWPAMADLNLLFVVSAFESVDETTLQILDKGHDVADMEAAVALTRSAGVHVRPTWLPFFPWTELEHVAGIFEFLDRNQLVGATDPVQMAIKLLVPRGSLLEDHPAMRPHLGGYDEEALTWRWDFVDREVEKLCLDLEVIAEAASDCGQEAAATLAEMASAVSSRIGRPIELASGSRPAPRLSESWFCCAEPTRSQAIKIGMPTG